MGRLSSGYGNAADTGYSQVYVDGEPSQQIMVRNVRLSLCLSCAVYRVYTF